MLSPAQLNTLLCSPSPPCLLLISSSDTPHQGTSPQGRGAQEGQDLEQSSNIPMLSAQQFPSPPPHSGTWRAPAWMSLEEMSGCGWGAQPSGLRTCSRHIGETSECCPKDGAQPATFLGASQVLETTQMKKKPLSVPTQQSFLLHQHKFGHSEAVDDTEMKWWLNTGQSQALASVAGGKSHAGNAAPADRLVQGSTGTSQGEKAKPQS